MMVARSWICSVSLEWVQVVVDVRIRLPSGGGGQTRSVGSVLNDSATEFEIRPSTDRLSGLIFVPVPEAKQSTIRLHLDFRPDDQQAEVERFLRVGARRVDIGQGSSPWVVLADPEGNEFDVLPPRGT
jgi:Glyoxalase-like domain